MIDATPMEAAGWNRAMDQTLTLNEYVIILAEDWQQYHYIARAFHNGWVLRGDMVAV